MVFESDRHELFLFRQPWVLVGDNFTLLVSELEAPKPCEFRVSFDLCFDILTGSHGEEKGPHYKIDRMIVFDALLAGDPL